MFATDAAHARSHARTGVLDDAADDAMGTPFHTAFPDAFGLPAPAAIALPDSGANPNTIVFVDSRVKAADTLLRDLPPGAEVVFLQPGDDGLAQMAAALAVRPQAGAVSIIAHGSPGDLWLGDTYLSAENLAQHAEALAAIGARIDAGGDLLVYACNTAEGERGASFVQTLAELTGRDVAASSDRTGAGGDWELEISTGAIASTHVLPQQLGAGYAFGLATWTATNNLNTGVGSLRAALASAQNGDVVTFNNTMTVGLTSVLIINKNITIDGDLNNDNVADVTLDGQFRTQVLNITSGTTAMADGLVITRGMVAGNGGNGGDDALVSKGGAIYNAGDFTLTNVTVTANAASGGGGGGGVTPQYAGGGGGGGGAIGSGIGGRGGDTLNSTGSNGSAGQGGAGGGFFNIGGRGGSTTGGAGGAAYPGYSTGSAGATASSGGLSIGGGGGGDGYDDIGGAGAGAVGGIYNDTGATLKVIGNSVISNNVGAGGGGGGGGAGGSYTQAGGAGGLGVGAIWNKGAVLITAANFSALTGNVGASGNGGTSAGSAGVKPTAVNNIHLDGGTLNSAYVPAPTATIVVADSALQIGETSAVTFTFSEAVTGFDNSDLTIASGTLSNVASGNGGITWTAVLTPDAGVSDSTNLIILNNTGVQNGLGAAGIGTTSSNNYAVDTVRPDAAIVVADTALRAGETSLVTFTFTEAVTGFTTADLTVNNGIISGLSSADGGITWTATLTPTAAVTSTANVVRLDKTGVADQAGNAGSGSTDSNNYAVDTARPTASLVVASPTLGVGQTSGVTITFSEAVTGFTLADLTTANGVLSGLSSADGGITWSATLTPSAAVTDATNIITLANTGVADASGNTGTGTTNSNNYAIDTVRPSATIVVANSVLAAGQSSLVTFTFSEAVSGFTAADLTVANGSLAGLSSSDGGVTWTATLTPAAAVTDATNLITLDNTGVADAAGNAGTGTTSSNNYAIDTVRPTATIVVADTALRIGTSSLVTFTFSEAVSGFTLADLSVANGSLAGLSTADNITYTATLTPAASVTAGANLITLANSGVLDTAGNTGSGTTDSNSYAVDTVRPGAAIVVAAASLAAGQTSLVTVAFTEAVTGFTAADLSVANGAVSGLSSADGGITWTATLTPAAAISDTTNVITLANSGLADLAGNVGSGTTTSNNYAVDTQGPSASIVVADTALKIGETSLVTFTFSEAVSGFTTADLSVANGSLANLSSSDGGITWTATLTPTAAVTDATNLITLDNTGVADAGGNAGSGTTDSNNYAIDTTAPTATIVVADTALTVGETSLVTITFAEAVSGFTAADLSVANGSIAGLASTDGGITWTATLTPGAGVNDATNLIVLNNAGVADAAGNAGSGTTDSNNYSVNTFVNSAPAGTVTIAGSAVQGQTLNASNTLADADGLGTISYQWRADGVDLAGAVGASLTLTEAQVGKAISVAASYTDGQGTPESLASAPTGTVANVNDAPTGAVTISGVASQGQTLTAANTLADLDGLGPISYQWQAGGINIGGATTTSLTLDESLVGKAIGLVASYIDGHGTPEAVGAIPTLPVTNTNDAPTGSVTISGALVQGQTLTAANTLADSDGLGTIAYRWRADGVDIVGATGSAFTLSEAQVGKTITVVASYVDGRGTAEAVTSSPSGAVANLNDVPTGGVSLSGNAAQGQTLTAANTLADADGLGTITYQWQAGGVAIGGAVNASYTLTAAEVGKTITVVARYVDGHGTTESVTSAASTAVTASEPPPPPPPPPPPTVDGVPVQTVVVPNPVTGLPEQIVNVPIVTASRPEDSATPNSTLADIPLIASGGAGAGSLSAGVTVSLPTGSGFQSGGSATLLTGEQALLDLIARIDSKTVNGSPAEQAMMAQATQFLNALPGATLLATRTLVPVVAAGTTLSQPIVITGAAPAAGPGGTTASAIGLVIDATSLPVSAVLQLDNVDFAAIIGAATLRGGAGQNFVIGDDAAQNMVLGPDDDILFGGGGDDVVGSAGGNDRLDGGSGKDIVFGGIGNDTLAGGTGADMLQGGRSDQGRWDFYLNAQGQVVGMHNTALVNAAATEVLTRADLNLSVGKLAFAQGSQEALQSLSLLYHAAFGRTPDLAGLSYWTHAGRGVTELVHSFMQSGEWKEGLGKLGDVEFINQLYKNALGRAGTADEVAASLARITAAADHEQGRAQVFDAVALGAAHRSAWQGANGMALGGEVLAQEQGWIKGGGDDRLDGGAGNDLLVGGDGNDTVVYAGVRANYAIGLTSDGQVTVTDRSSGDIDRIVQVEQGVFTDGTVDLSFTSASQPLLQQLGLMYQALFNRAGDLAGLNYWTSNGVSATAVAAQFLGSAEFRQQSGNLSDEAFVNLLFQNAVEHSPAADRLAYWDSYLDTHSRAEMVAALTENADLLTGQYGTEGLWLV